jgi:hypothetical protein
VGEIGSDEMADGGGKALLRSCKAASRARCSPSELSNPTPAALSGIGGSQAASKLTATTGRIARITADLLRSAFD